MIGYAIYILSVIGIGYFVTESSLVKPVRERISLINAINMKFKPVNWIWDKFNGVMNCIYCASFWIGLTVYYFTYFDLSIYTILYPFSAMGSIYVIKNISKN